MTRAAGRRRKIITSSTLKLPLTANRVDSTNAAQIITLANAANSPNARVLGRHIDFASYKLIDCQDEPHGIIWHGDALAEKSINQSLFI